MHNVYIRPLREEDSEISYKWRNDAQVWTFTGSKPDREITYEIEKEWILKVLNDHTAKRFAIIVDENYVGNIQLTNISSTSAEYHIFIGDKEYWGKGVAYLATYQILNYAKEELKLLNINLSVREDNVGAIKTYLKNGFEKVSNNDGWISMIVSLEKLPIPTVSIFCMVYNHEKYLRDTLEGFLMQKTNFNTLIVIGEDCSTDNSRKLLLEYVCKYPGKFKLLLHDKNIGAHANQDIILKNCLGKYIAMCEGDDFWTDPSKLQKQVDFLEQNVDCSMCFHDVYVQNEIDNSYRDFYDVFAKPIPETFTDFKTLLQSNYIPTLSVLYRNYNFPLPKEFLKFTVGDWPLHLLHARFGKIAFINEKMAVYRIHGAGAHRNGAGWDFKRKYKELKSEIDILNMLMKHVDKKYFKLIRKRKFGIKKYTVILFTKTYIIRNQKILIKLIYIKNKLFKNI